MNLNQIVDLSNDCNDEIIRKRINRKKLNELRRYIPFLDYISKLDPIKNSNYGQLLRWLTLNKEFPASMAATCENNIIAKYNKIKYTVEIPTHVAEVFTEKDAILISDEDDEQPTAKNSDQLLTDFETIDLEDYEPTDSLPSNTSKNAGQSLPPRQKHKHFVDKDLPSSTAKKKEPNTSNFTIQSEGAASNTLEKGLLSSTAKEKELNTANITINNQIQADGNLGASFKTVLEEGEILSDSEEIKENKDKHEPPSKSIQKITTKKVDSVFSTASEDDIINQELFKKIDCFEDDYSATHTQTSLTKEKDEEAKIPILRQKNLEFELFSRRSPKPVRSESLSAISSEDTFAVISHKKKKKKHKHKKKNKQEDETDKYVSEKEAHSDRNKKEIIKDQTKGPKRSKKSSKKQIEVYKNSRFLYISDEDDDDNEDISVKNHNNNDMNLPENLKESKETHEILPVSSSIEPPTVVLSDSNDEEVSKLSSQQGNNSKSPIEVSSEIVNTVPSPKSVVESVSSIEADSLQNKEIKSMTTSMQDINNMNLNELNNIYTKLCEATGIQLEELLFDLVGKSTRGNEQNAQIDTSDISRTPTETNSGRYIPQQYNQIINSGNNIQSREESLNMFPFQHHHIQFQQNQEKSYQLETYNQQPQVQMKCQLPVQLPFQHTLRPGLNLNDPRIVQRLKQIKDTPIHNLSIREYASFLMNHHARAMQQRPLIVPEVTSKTATTYGEHKRLRELERKKELERQNSRTSTSNTNQTNESLRPSEREGESVIRSTSGKFSDKQSSRSLSESSGEEYNKKVSKPGNEKTMESTEKTIMSFAMNRPLSRTSSLSEDNTPLSEKSKKTKENISSGRITPFEREQVVDIVLSAIGHVSDDTCKKLKKLSRLQSDSCHSPCKEDERPENALQKLPNNSMDISLQNKDNTHTEDNNEIENRVKKKGRPPLNKHKNSSSGPKKSPSKIFGIRELNNLNCTFLDYREIFEKNFLFNNAGKRRCSGLSNIRRDLSSSDETSQNSDDKNDSKKNRVKAASITRRRQTCSALHDNPKPKKDNLPPIKVVLRRLSESGTFGVQNSDLNNYPVETEELETEHQSKENQYVQSVKVKLKKLSFDEIKKKSNSNVSCINEDSSKQKSFKSHEEPILVPVSSEPVDCSTNSNPRPLRHLNDNIKMTLNSTKVCAICNKRAGDLTSHYVGQHKTESYVSRLKSVEIENLESHVKFATINRKRYKITCVFCQDELEVNNFVHFHAHYSYHTGEYGFKCDVCEVVRPYREDIKSHQLRSSRCRNGKIRTNYLYQSDLKVIFLYVCKLCNFVQLNEANIHKHQREHHSFRFEEPENVKKCIICALDDIKVRNELLPSNETEYLEGERLEREYLELGKNSVPQEQEFVHEFPLDIKDVLFNLECENNSQDKDLIEPKCDDPSKESNAFAASETVFVQVHDLKDSSKKMDSQDSKAATVEEQQGVSSTSHSSTVTDLVHHLHASNSVNNVMTIIHSTGQTSCIKKQQKISTCSSNMVSKENLIRSVVNTSNIMTVDCISQKQYTKQPISCSLNVTDSVNSASTINTTILPAEHHHDPTISENASRDLPQQAASQAIIFPKKDNTVHKKHIDELVSSISPSPETLLGQLHGLENPNYVMTIIHHTEQALGIENHQPYEEPADVKPNINEIKIENLDELENSELCPSLVKQFSYRKVIPGINYFGLYKCMISDCWFSTNEAEKYIRHVDIHKVDGKKLILYCAYCASKKLIAKQLVRHVRTRHSMSLFQCSICTYRSMLPGNVCLHLEMNHKDIAEEKCIFKCAGRVRTLESKLATFKEKMKVNVNKFFCRDCPAQYYSISLMKSHLETTQHSINSNALVKYACMFCEVESNSLVDMQIHLVTLHPNDMCYVVERELNNETDKDSIENLKMINISPPTMEGVKVRVAEFKEEVLESVQITNKIEINLIECIKPLLELITEHTGVYRSELYKCTVCSGSFFTYDLWLNHVQNRHDINDKIVCPYCPQQVTLDEVSPHFESHLRHEYFCLHCVQTFGSKIELEEHFDTSHKNFEKLIEKPIVYSNLKTYYIIKGGEDLLTDWIPVLESFLKVLRSRCIKKLYENRNSEWCYGSLEICFEDVDIPQFVTSVGTIFKCLVNSCAFDTSDEYTFDVHLNQHTVPRNYQCSYCVKSLKSSWECIKDHYMLHKSNTSYTCCVCKFIHHNRAVVTEHIQKFHNIRDVPIITLWRNGTKFKTSVSIVMPANKIGFVTTTSCFCCRQGMANGREVMNHLKDAHEIALCSKCEICEEILLNREETESHPEKHGGDIFKIRYDILAPSVYNLCVTSISPLCIDMKLKTEKRLLEVETDSSKKRIKLDEQFCLNIKQEINKDEGCEDANMNNCNSFEKPSCSIKCVNIEQLVSNRVINSIQPFLNQPTTVSVYKPVEDLQIRPVVSCHSNTFNEQQNNNQLSASSNISNPQIKIINPDENIQPMHIAQSQQAPHMASQPTQLMSIQPFLNQPTTVTIYKPVEDLQIRPIVPCHSNTFNEQQNNNQLSASSNISNPQIKIINPDENIQPMHIAQSQQAPHTASQPTQLMSSQRFSMHDKNCTPITVEHHEVVQPLQTQYITSQSTTSVPQYISNHNIQYAGYQQATQLEPTSYPSSSLSTQLGPTPIQPHLPIGLQSQNNMTITLPTNQGIGTISSIFSSPTAHTTSVYNKGPHCSYQKSATITTSGTFQINQTQTLNSNQKTQTMEEIAMTIDLHCPEIMPICGKCKRECTNFVKLLSHYNALHSDSFRFLYRIERRVECVYCPYRGSISSLTAHYSTFHPGKAYLCRSVIDSTRCGKCHGVFNLNPSVNNTNHPKCNCAINKRVIADCISIDTLQLLQKFGKKSFGFLCQICKKIYHFEMECLNHIKTEHKRFDLPPKVCPFGLLYSCFMCEKITMRIQDLIIHISDVHMVNRSRYTLDARLAYYKQFRLIYPRGLILSLSDLCNTGFYEEENLKKDILTVDDISRN